MEYTLDIEKKTKFDLKLLKISEKISIIWLLKLKIDERILSWSIENSIITGSRLN